MMFLSRDIECLEKIKSFVRKISRHIVTEKVKISFDSVLIDPDCTFLSCFAGVAVSASFTFIVASFSIAIC